MSTFVWIPGGMQLTYSILSFLFLFFVYGVADVAQAGFGQG